MSCGDIRPLRVAERSGNRLPRNEVDQIETKLYIKNSKFTIYMIACVLHSPFFRCKGQTIKLIPNSLRLKCCECHLRLRGPNDKSQMYGPRRAWEWEQRAIAERKAGSVG